MRYNQRIGIRNMSSIGFVTNNNTNKIESFYSDSIQNRLDKINSDLKDLPTVLDPTTLQKLKDGEYEITLKEYHNMSSYRTTMSALYGNSSASKFPSMLNGLLGNEEAQINSAKDFLDKMQKKGIKKETALKLYTAMKSYSAMNTYLGLQNSYVSAII